MRRGVVWRWTLVVLLPRGFLLLFLFPLPAGLTGRAARATGVGGRACEPRQKVQG